MLATARAFCEEIDTVKYAKEERSGNIWNLISRCSTVQDLHVNQIRSLVRNMERDIRDIFEGKVIS